MMNRAKRVHKFCPHCEKECNIKTYKEYKRLFFNSDLKTWYTARPLPEKKVDSDSDSLLSFPDDSDESSDVFDDNEVGLGCDEPSCDCAGELIHGW